MKRLVHYGQEYPTENGESEMNYILIEVAAPSASEFVKVKALIDTGASSSVITASLIERLGIDSVLPYLGDQVSDTANGTVKEPTTAVVLRMTGSDGRVTLFQDWPMTISKSLSEPIIGLDVLQYFAMQMRHGLVVNLTFDEGSSAGIQKRRQGRE
ncbi:MAG: retroviral-like aspartic protease family protein [Bdellovibrio sp.]